MLVAPGGLIRPLSSCLQAHYLLAIRIAAALQNDRQSYQLVVCRPLMSAHEQSYSLALDLTPSASYAACEHQGMPGTADYHTMPYTDSQNGRMPDC